MKAARVHHFGGPSAIAIEDIELPSPGEGEVLVRVKAAGVGPWDGWVRSGKSVLPQPLPLTLGADIAGLIEAIGAGVTDRTLGEAVYGVTNPRFTGACAEFAVASAKMLAKKPLRLDFATAAGVPVVAVTAKQMLFDHGKLAPDQTVLIHGGAGNVGAFAIQLARHHGARVIATGLPEDIEQIVALGAERAIDVKRERIEHVAKDIDLVLDTVGPMVHAASLVVLRRGGRLISSVAAPDAEGAGRAQVQSKFMLVDVNTADLDQLRALIDDGAIRVGVGAVLPLERVVDAHEMLDGSRPRPAGKIVLRVTE